MKPAKKTMLILLLISLIAGIFIGMPLLESISYAIALAYIARPVAFRLRKWIGPTWSTLLTLIGIAVALSLFISYTGVLLATELININSYVNNEQITTALNLMQDQVNQNPEVMQQLTQITANYLNNIPELITVIGSNLTGILLGIVNFIITLFMTVIIAFYFIKDGNRFKKLLLNILPATREIKEMVENIDRGLQSVFVSSVGTSAFTAIITTLGAIWLKIPYAAVIGITCGILQFIPLVGPQTLLIPLTIISIIIGQPIWAVLFFVLAIFLTFIPDVIIKPLIVGRTSDVHALVILISFIGGAVVLGPKGFVLGPIILVTLSEVAKTYAKMR